MQEQTTDDFDEFDDIIELNTDDLDSFKNILHLPVYPCESVVLPWEWTTLEITDPAEVLMFRENFERKSLVGITTAAADAQTLPATGAIGVAAHILEITETDFGNLHLVRVYGRIRYRLDDYVQIGKPYPVAAITFFDDIPATDEGEIDFGHFLFEEFRGLLLELIRLNNAPRHNEYHAERLEFEKLTKHSFFFWFMLRPKSRNPPDAFIPAVNRTAVFFIE